MFSEGGGCALPRPLPPAVLTPVPCLALPPPAASVTGPLRPGEHISPALRTVRTILRLPHWFKRLHAALLRWLSRPRGRNDAWAALLEVFHPKSAREERKLVVERDAYRAAWHEAWRREGLDFVLAPPHAMPAMPVDPAASDRATLVSANYSFLYNVVRPAPSLPSLLPFSLCSAAMPHS